MSFLYEKGRAATFCLLLCAYRFKKGSASLVFELDDYEICRSSGCFFLFRFRPRVVNKCEILATLLAALKYLHKGTNNKKTDTSVYIDSGKPIFNVFELFVNLGVNVQFADLYVGCGSGGVQTRLRWRDSQGSNPSWGRGGA